MSAAVPPSARSSLERLLSLKLDEGRLLILTHDNPDPDCLASSVAMQFLLAESLRIASTVAYSGIIGRAENRAMVRLLNLPEQHVSELDFSEFRYLALMDAQPHTGNTAVPPERTVDIVIDHHPLRPRTAEAAFHEVLPELGATATLLTEYLRAADLEIPSDLATALLYGIRSETQDLGQEASERDRAAYHYLFERCDTAKLAAISRPPLERRYYEQLAVALDSLRYAGSSMICAMDEVAHPDFVPEIADLAVRMEGIRWSFASGHHAGRLYLSIRSDDPAANAGAIMQEILKGIGRGGGHGMRAGGSVELDQVGSRTDAESLMQKRFLELTGAAGELVRVRSR